MSRRTSPGITVVAAATLALLWNAAPTFGQEHKHPPSAPGKPAAEDPHAGHSAQPGAKASHEGHHMHGAGSSLNEASSFLFRQSSGTAMQPAAWPMPMLMNRLGNWNFMWMGQAFIAGTQQSGPRGGDKVYSANWGMLSAVRNVGAGAIMLRSMVSLEPLTVRGRRYPLLFQTGESAYGQPIVDGQHPHDLAMELSAQYARPIGGKGIFNIYYAPVGDAALGPVAFPHRASAIELPQATLAHHWQDATHIANNLVTVGIGSEKVRLEASAFRGLEPNENRWNIDFGKMDSWSTRLSVFPNGNWMGQVSVGRLKQPEQFHRDDVVRTTASVHHVLPRPNGNYLATSVIWARNYKTIEKRSSQALVAETVVPVSPKNFLTGRFEWSQRDELFEYDHHLAEEIHEQTGKHAFQVVAYTAGYTRDIGTFRNLQTGLGANVTLYAIADELKPFYGSYPRGVTFFLRVRLKPTE